jgi:uncharacterized membrane protein HdeD (DUF308 family)
MNIEQITSLLLGLVIIGEAILLFIGMYLPRKKDNNWRNRFNLNTLLIDIAFGTIILFNAFEDMPFIILAVSALFITHLYREIEYFKKDRKSRFITNVPLFVFNSIKLIGLLGLFFMVL